MTIETSTEAALARPRVTVGRGSTVAFDGDRWYDPLVVTLKTRDWARSWRREGVRPALAVADVVIARHEPAVVRLRDPNRLADAVGTAGCETIERLLRRAAHGVGAELTVD